MRALFGKVNKTMALNSWLEDTALGELIGTRGNASSVAGQPAAHPRPSEPAPGPPSTPPARRGRPATSMAARRPRAAGRPSGMSRQANPAAAEVPDAEVPAAEVPADHVSPFPGNPPDSANEKARGESAVPSATFTPAPAESTASGDATHAAAAGTEPADTWPDLKKAPSQTTGPADYSDVTSTGPIPPVIYGPPVGTEPSGPHHPRPRLHRGRQKPMTGAPLSSAPLIMRGPRVSPRLRSDPRLRVWMTRILVMLFLFAGFTIWRDWRYGVTAAIIYAVADMVYRSKTTVAVPASARVTSAQRYTRRRLKVLQPGGYLALHARKIPGTDHVIDHVVVGPAGVFTLDSQRLDRRLPLRAIGGMLYHGRTSMEGRLDHAKDEARYAAKLIADELGRRVRVKPVMVMYGPSISWVIMQVKGVDVFDGSRIGTYFRRQTKMTAQYRLTSSQIAMVFAAAARALPPLN